MKRRDYLREKDYRSGQAFIVPQDVGSPMKLRFNILNNRYERLVDNGADYNDNDWKPLHFLTSEDIERQLRTRNKEIFFA